MDTEEDAREYDTMDHAAVNAQFVTDVLASMTGHGEPVHALDLGAGTAQIPIELCRRAPYVRVTAVDASQSMLVLARQNIAAAGLASHVEPVLADAKHLPFQPAAFPVVISNSILHHIAEPQRVITEAVRVVSRGGLLFHRDLCRPATETQLGRIVEAYAGGASPHQWRLFADSLRAALTLDEMREFVAAAGFAASTVSMTSDRHWTWKSACPTTAGAR